MLSETHIKGITARGISEETASRMGIYTGKRLRDGQVVADPFGDVLCLPFLENGVEVGCKYRARKDGEKIFWQRKGGKKTFFNADALMDPELLDDLEEGEIGLAIVEGEFDCMTAVEVGHWACVSVPDGAPPARDKHGQLIAVPDHANDIDPANDTKFDFLVRHLERLARVRWFILAVDADEPGVRLRKELIRRLGAARCKFVQYPTEEVVPGSDGVLRPVKDLNEVLMHFGKDAVRNLLAAAKPVPIKGLYKLADYPDDIEPTTYSTGFFSLDDHLRVYPGAFMVVTGIPGMGKSTFVNQMLVNLAYQHKWPVVLCSPEMPTVPYVANALRTAYLRTPRADWSGIDRKRADGFLNRYFTFLDPSVEVEDDADDLDVDYVIDKAITCVLREGAKVLVIDPWNELEHKRKSGVSLTEHTGDAIRKLKKFARVYGVLVIVVAHPKKIDAGIEPGLYDIADSAHWANKPDLAVVVHSDQPAETLRDINIKKVRFKSAGRRGKVTLDFNPMTELFRDMSQSGMSAPTPVGNTGQNRQRPPVARVA
jgi:twinkle protein